MLIAEDLLLLLTYDQSGKAAVDGTRLRCAVSGAVLVELVLVGRVAVTDGGRWGSGPRVAVVDPTPLGDPVLDEALARTAARSQPVGAQSLLDSLGKGLLEVLRTRLVDAGILREEESTVLWLFHSHSWPTQDASHEARLHQGLRDVLVTGREPDEREACLIALLDAVDQATKQFQTDGVSPGQIKARAKQIAGGNIGGEAARGAIEASMAAVAVLSAATIATTAATT